MTNHKLGRWISTAIAFMLFFTLMQPSYAQTTIELTNIFASGQCTHFAAEQRPDLWNIIKAHLGPAGYWNAGNWDDRFKSLYDDGDSEYLVDETPEVDAVIVWDPNVGDYDSYYRGIAHAGSVGHVGIVDSIPSGTQVSVEDANWDNMGNVLFHTVTITKGMHFIHTLTYSRKAYEQRTGGPYSQSQIEIQKSFSIINPLRTISVNTESEFTLLVDGRLILSSQRPSSWSQFSKTIWLGRSGEHSATLRYWRARFADGHQDREPVFAQAPWPNIKLPNFQVNAAAPEPPVPVNYTYSLKPSAAKVGDSVNVYLAASIESVPGAIEKIDVKVDGKLLGSTPSDAGNIQWDTHGLNSGPHVLTLEAHVKGYSGDVTTESIPYQLTAQSGNILSAPSSSQSLVSTIDNFLRSRSSHLAGFGATFVEAGQRYNVDPRFVVGISNAESTFGTNGDCASQRHNAWGYGGGWPSCWNFDSWDKAIEQVTLDIGNYYLKRGQTTIPSFVISPAGTCTGNHCWCASACSSWVSNVGDAYEALGGNRNTTDLSFSAYGGDKNPPPSATPPPPQIRLPKPTLSSPSNATNIAQASDIALSWIAIPGATQYKVEVWGGQYSLMTSCDWQSGTSCHIGQMWPGTMSWHVKARNGSGQESDWSDTWSFTVQQATAIPTTPTPRPTTPVPPAANSPILSGPSNNASMPQSTNVILSWNPSSNAYQYKVELWGGPYSLMTPCDWQSSTSCSIGQMWPGTMSWHVKARNASGQETNWSDTWSFTIQQPAPIPTTPAPPPSASKPSLSSPGNGTSMAQSTNVVLSWNSSANAVQYKVELWGGPYSIMTPCNWQSGTTCTIGQMWPGTMSWHVKARNRSGQESDWSDTWSFTIQQPPPPSAGKPSLSSPNNGASMAQSTDVTLVWDSASNAAQYKVELWGGPYSLMTPCNWQSSTSCHIGQMWPGTMSWHVKAKNSSGKESDWSDTWSFTIQNNPPPTSPPTSNNKPSLSSPGNGSSLARSTDVTLRWNSLSGYTQYKVELWGGPYSLMVPCNWQSGTSCHIGQMWPGTMRWHVKARDASGRETDWSDEWNFTIQN